MELPPARDPFEVVLASSLEFDVRAGDRVLYCPRNKDLTRTCDCRDAGSDMDCDPAQIVANHFAFSGVDPGPHL